MPANHAPRVIAAAVPVVLVNCVAFAGQLAFLRDHLPWPLPGQVMVAVALESVAVYLAFHAHMAQVANDSALRLRLAAYGFAAVIAAMNYSHYCGPHWAPTFTAVAFALMSLASPWLWSVHSRRVSRDALMAAGLVEPHALRLGVTRWLWHPVRSARVMWLATWEGETDPRAAIGLLAESAPEDAPAAVPVGAVVKPKMPSTRQVRDIHNCGPETEQKIRSALRTRDSQWVQALEPYQAAAPAAANGNGHG